MPHAFSRDESTLLLLDGHGLTRFVAKGRPRTVAKLCGGDEALVTLDDESCRCVVWNPIASRYHDVNVRDLAVAAPLGALAPAIVHPSGDERVEVGWDAFTHFGRTPAPERGARWPEPRAIDLALGPDGPPRDTLSTRWSRSSAGDFALLRESGEHTCVYVGATRERPWRCAHAWRIALRGDGFSRVWAKPGGATVAVHDLRSGRAHVATLDIARAPETFSLPSRSPPAPRGNAWITQPDDDLLLAVDREGAAHGRWRLPPSLAGAGELVVGERRAWWCSPDGTQLLDLDTGALQPRPLPASTARFRAAVGPWLDRLHAAGARHGRRFAVCAITPEAKGQRAGIACTLTPGDRSMASWFLGAAAYDARAWADAAPLHPASLAAWSRPGSFAGLVDEAAVRDLLAAADRASLPITLVAQPLWLHFEMSRLRGCTWDDPSPELLLTRAGASLLLRAMLADLAPRGEAPRTPAHDTTPWTLDAVRAGFAAAATSPQSAFDVLLAVVLALEALPPTDAAPLVAWCDEHVAPHQDHRFWDAWKRLRARLPAVAR